MADFDAIRKEVEQLEARHLELSILKPKLEEEINGLREELKDLQKKVVDEQGVLENVKREIADKHSHFFDYVETEKSNIKAERDAFESYRAEKSIEIDQQAKLIKDAETEIKERQNELDTLLERQVAGEKAFEQQMVDFQKVVSSHIDEKAKLNKEKEQFLADRKLLDEQILSVSHEQALLTANQKKLNEMSSEAQSKLKAANALLAEAKERSNLVSLKEDEIIRKEQLIEETTKRLRKKEIAINDKERVYNSQKI